MVAFGLSYSTPKISLNVSTEHIGEHTKCQLFSMYVLALARCFLDSFLLLPNAKYRHPTLLPSLFGAVSKKLVAALLVFFLYYAFTS